MREFERMKTLADRRGSFIAIGHPHSATLELLERELPKLAAEGYKLVTLSEVVTGRGKNSLNRRPE